MKISEITADQVASDLKLTAGEYDPVRLEAIMNAAKEYIVDYTGLPESSTGEAADTIDKHEKFYIAYMVLCQDMLDNQAMYVDKDSVNKVVESILGMHCVNLL